ncbi:hypothetical protein [Candidatus Lucifugimonas marina]|uniref:Uncharacterized protein n=1 Tax=Candidatus Lucifugimonas marina TaxID=3038979 RepID=A0AAJ6CUI4_9CHLR|nr:hypothetical protein [SAR202 cluster bacterium JH639]WFG38795.1 hypothetical protein GKO48_03940 [SAR202 cluster bacterium JH1073]
MSSVVVLYSVEIAKLAVVRKDADKISDVEVSKTVTWVCDYQLPGHNAHHAQLASIPGYLMGIYPVDIASTAGLIGSPALHDLIDWRWTNPPPGGMYVIILAHSGA